MLHFAGQFKVHTQANIYLETAVSDGYFKRIVGFKALSHVSLLQVRTQTRGMLRLAKTILALLDSLIFLSIFGFLLCLSK